MAASTLGTQMKLHDILLQFPLFYGIAKDDLDNIVSHIKFDFSKLQGGCVIARDGEVCDRLIMITHGCIEAKTTAFDNGYWVCEALEAPFLIQPHRLFGLSQRFSTTFYTKTECNLISLAKVEVVMLLENFELFRLNYINSLALMAQKGNDIPWRHHGMNVREKVCEFFIQRVTKPAGGKEFHILMTRLAQELNYTRLEVSKVLNQMENEGLLELHRGRVVIPHIERLV